MNELNEKARAMMNVEVLDKIPPEKLSGNLEGLCKAHHFGCDSVRSRE